ncbi:AAA family ATPase [Thermomicrobium sp. 4228-Ro]|uniref:AAA family ATPase n=1 Tax=Thermomicrobium sp. 4228-Ro TaxID=2993937 RepID=UPI00224920D9|nr:AAA family ATPase [Thermomicrobium sp. 4228-Ro]MCX2727892.1 AAA family ATPase [Thermomicrobium sp. 4228-Ro]
MSGQIQTVPKARERRRYWDDLEQQIDDVIVGLADLIRTHFRGLMTLAALAYAFYTWAWPARASWGPIVLTVLFALLQIAFAIVFVIVQFAAIFWFLGRGRTYWIKPGETGVSFADYKGNPEVLESARRIVTLLRGIKEFKEMGGEAIRGLLLVGPPGTGKSYLAQCISTEANVPFGYASAPSFQNMFFGVSNLRIMMLYRKARKLAKKYGACILFIDEIDAIGQARGGRYAGGGFMGPLFGWGGSAMLNELLLQLDPPPQEVTLIGRILRLLGLRKGRAELPPVLTIAATNMPDALDPALLRPGRFDRKIVVDVPNAEGRREIIEYYLSKVKHDPNIPIDYMVYDTIGYTPAAIRYVINEAVIHAHFEGRNYITYEDFTAARETHELGLRQPIRTMSLDERRRIAYHEAGHALAQYLLQPRERVVKVSIIRRGEALGFSATKPTEERFTKTREELLADIQVALAARAAEELFLGTQMTGATSDLAQATHLANLMVSAWGMDGSLYSGLTYNQMVPDLYRKQRIERLLQRQFQNVKRLLEANREAVVAIAEELLKHDELNEQQLREILSQFQLVVPPPLPEAEEPLEARQAEERAILAQLDGVQEPSSAVAVVGDGEESREGRPDTGVWVPRANSGEGRLLEY